MIDRLIDRLIVRAKALSILWIRFYNFLYDTFLRVIHQKLFQ